jgi:hypothetical protein
VSERQVPALAGQGHGCSRTPRGRGTSAAVVTVAGMKFEEINRLSEAELEQKFDSCEKGTRLWTDFWRSEIAYRRAERQGDRIERMTWVMVAMTV